MKLERIKQYKRTLRKTSGVLKNNAVLGLGLALPFAIVPSLTLKNGVAMSLIVAAAVIPATLLLTWLQDRIPLWAKGPICITVSMLCVTTAAYCMKGYPVIVESLGVYIYLAAANTILLHLSVRHPRGDISAAAIDALRMCLGFALVCCGISALREIFGSRTIWGISFGIYPIKMPGVMLPFFGFILLGFISALFRSIDRAVVKLVLGSAARRREEADGNE